MAEVTLLPNLNGDTIELTAYPGTGEANYENVDETWVNTPPLYGSDGDTTRNSNEAASPNNFLKDLYQLESLPAGVGTISNVRVRTIARRYSVGGSPYSGSYYILIKTGGTEYSSTLKTLLSSYTSGFYDWATNPGTSLAWAVDEVNALQAGASLQATFGADPNEANHPRLSLVSVIVTYTPTAPTVTTQACTLVSHTTATGNGNITDIGGAAVTQHGHCWSTSANPTTADSKTTNGAGSAGAFTSAITGLTAGITYHTRAYATNEGGTSYGADVEFTTVAGEGGGIIAVVETRLHYVDAYGTERFIEGTIVT